MHPGHWSTVFPDKPAVINTVTGESLTHGELNDRSNQLAQLMWDKGLRKGDHVAIFMENNIRYFEAVWASLRSGLYLTTVNRYLTTEEAGYIVDNCEAKVTIASAYLKDIARDLPEYAPNCHTWLMLGEETEGYDDYSRALDAYPTEPLAEQPMGSFMLYSSGTTGRPKGIHRPLEDQTIDGGGLVSGGLQRLLWGFDENCYQSTTGRTWLSSAAGREARWGPPSGASRSGSTRATTAPSRCETGATCRRRLGAAFRSGTRGVGAFSRWGPAFTSSSTRI